MNLLTNRLDWLTRDFERMLGNGAESTPPALDIREDAERFSVDLEVPGLKPEAVEVTFSEGVLTLKGERRWEKTEGTTWHRRERAHGAFERSVSFPTAVDSGKIEASFKDGILTVSLPKAEEAKPRKVQVKYLESK